MMDIKTNGRQTKDENIAVYRRHLPLWMRIFHLPSEPSWFMTVTILNYITVIGHLYLSVNEKCIFLMEHIKMSEFILLDSFYMIDIILILGCKYIRNLELPDINISMRPLAMLMVEFISILPLELMTSNKKLICILHTNRCIRIARILHIFRRYRNFIDSNISIKVIEMFSCMLFITMITYSIYCNSQCFYTLCDVNEKCSDERALVMVSTKITLSGLCKYPPYRFNFELITMLAGLISFFFVFTTTLVSMMIGLVNFNHHQVSFVDNYNANMLFLEGWNVPEYLKKSAIVVFNTFWVHCRGYNADSDFLEILPDAMKTGVMVDVFWPTFKHSKLFKSMDISFLRHVSTIIKRSFMMPGDFIYRKNDCKNKMIYIVSGTIQLLSEEDGESPILSFTSGTCLGESSLGINYNSINSVRCKTFCEIHVLNKNDFIRVFKKFPNHVREILGVIAARYDYAKSSNELSTFARKRLNMPERQIDIFTIFWMKNALHRLMAHDSETAYKHEFQNIFLLNEINEKYFNKMLFCASYLDSYVICERVETDTDMLFAKTRFPCILQPNSVLIILWESLVIVFTVLASFLIPHMALVMEKSPEWYVHFVYMSTFLFWCDIYVQLSTGVKTKLGMITKIRTIISVRMQTLGFWADMLSCVPCEMFSPIIIRTINDKDRAKLHMNRILKLWRVEKLFRLWEKKFNANMVMIRLVKFSWINMYTAFVLYCYFYKTHVADIYTLVFSAIEVTTGMGILDSNFTMENAISIIADTITTLINLMMYAYIGSAYILKNLRYLEVHQMWQDLVFKIIYRQANNQFLGRITNFIETEMRDNGCERIKHLKSVLLDMSELTYSETIESMIGDIIQTAPLFQGVSDEVILDVYSKLRPSSLPPNEYITHAGDLVHDIYIYYAGECAIINRAGEIEKEIDKYIILNVLETLFALPAINTIITQTYCRFFMLPYISLIEILTKYPTELKCLRQVVSESSDIKKAYLKLCEQPISSITVESKSSNNLLYFFSYNFKPDSFAEFDYHVPFDHMYPFAFIRYFLLRITFMPDGKLIYIWEAFRCVFAVLSCILYFTLPLIDDGRFKIALRFLDLTALVDIYFRMHVCYYNEKGILVKHPLKTATHYLSHSFIVDLFGFLPFGITKKAKDSQTYIALQLHVLLQMHRYLQFVQCLRVRSLMPLSKWHVLFYFPPIIILCNLLGSLLIAVNCNYDMEDYTVHENFTAGIECLADSILTVSNFTKPIDPIRAHFYGIYVVTSMITMVGMQGWNHGNHFTRIVIMVLSIIGLYLNVIINARVYQIYSFTHSVLLQYQDYMRSLRYFLRKHKVSYKLRKSIIENYELKWQRINGSYLQQLVKPFTHSIRIDITYDMIGKYIYKNSPMKSANKDFYRNISPLLYFELIMKGGYVVTINDVSENLCILLRGIVDVLAADGTKLDTLYQGSMFGNLENSKRSRQLVSIVALCHVEFMFIPATQFHEVLMHEVKLKEEFQLLKAKYVSYLPSYQVTSSKKMQGSVTNTIGSYYFFKVFNPNSRFIQLWNAINLIFSCYIGILLDFYQLGSGENSTSIIIVQYISDLIYVTHVVSQNFTAYFDAAGYMVTDLEMIRIKVHGSNFQYWIKIISLIPADVLILTIPMDTNVQILLFGLFRLNRVLRLTFIFQYFESSSKKLNVNLATLRFGYVLLWSSLVINAMAGIMGLLSCALEVNMEPHVPSCFDLHKLTAVEKFKKYVSYLYIISNCITQTSQHVYFPQGLYNILLCIVFMFTGQFVRINIISQIFSIFNESSFKRLKFKNLFNQIIDFLKNADVSSSIIVNVTTYIQLIWIQQNGVVYPKLMRKAPIYLKDAICNNAFSHLLANHPIFVGCHPDCFRQIVQKLHYTIYYVDDYIQFKNAIDEKMYFIYEGEVSVLIDEFYNRDEFLFIMRRGESFGIKQGLFRQTPHNFSYRCMRRTIMLSLNLDSWEYLLDFFPASKEQIYKAARVYDGP